MLIRLPHTTAQADLKGAFCSIGNSLFPEPFRSTLEYNAPARGPWNIVHTGMLIPQSHQIFICARGCLRGVILTAAEMNAMDRMSYVTVEEEDFLTGSMEDHIIEGVSNILAGMETLPKAVLVFVSCIHLFAGNDMEMILRELRQRFPRVHFTDCYMHPTMRKTMLTPDQTMRKQLYSFLQPVPEKDPKQINIIGNDRITEGEMICYLQRHNFKVMDIARCRDFSQYEEMARSSLNIVTQPAAVPAGRELESRLGQRMLYLPLRYDPEGIKQQYRLLAETLHIPLPEDLQQKEKEAFDALKETLSVVKDTPVVLDYTASSRPLGLARLLLEHSFNVRTVFADVFIPEEKSDWEFLKTHYSSLTLASTVRPEMRFVHPREKAKEKTICIGQKCAYFVNSPHFVNIVAGGFHYGFSHIKEMAQLILEAYLTEKNTCQVIQHKGWGCESCL